jgi:hypothetical protein
MTEYTHPAELEPLCVLLQQEPADIAAIKSEIEKNLAGTIALVANYNDVFTDPTIVSCIVTLASGDPAAYIQLLEVKSVETILEYKEVLITCLANNRWSVPRAILHPIYSDPRTVATVNEIMDTDKYITDHVRALQGESLAPIVETSDPGIGWLPPDPVH